MLKFFQTIAEIRWRKQATAWSRPVLEVARPTWIFSPFTCHQQKDSGIIQQNGVCRRQNFARDEWRRTDDKFRDNQHLFFVILTNLFLVEYVQPKLPINKSPVSQTNFKGMYRCLGVE